MSYRSLGGGGQGLVARAETGGRPRPPGARDRWTRSQSCRASRSVHRRRSGPREGTGREPVAWHGARGAPARSVCRPADTSDGARCELSRFSVSGQGPDGHHRSTSRHSAIRRDQVRRICGVAVLAARPHLLSDRISESNVRGAAVGLVVFQLRAWRPPDRRQGVAILR